MDASRTAAARDRLTARFEKLFAPGPSESLFVQPLVSEAITACRQEARLDSESRVLAIVTQANLEQFLEQLTMDGVVPHPLMNAHDLRGRLVACIPTD